MNIFGHLAMNKIKIVVKRNKFTNDLPVSKYEIQMK